MPRNKLQKEEAADDDKIAQDQQGHHHHVVGQVASFVFLGRLHKEEEEEVTVDNEQRKVEEVDVNDKLQNTVLLTIKLQEQDTADNDKKSSRSAASEGHHQHHEGQVLHGHHQHHESVGQKGIRRRGCRRPQTARGGGVEQGDVYDKHHKKNTFLLSVSTWSGELSSLYLTYKTLMYLS